MKTEFYTGSLDAIVHWLNIETSKVLDGHFFSGHTIQVLPQGLFAQAIFLTKEEEESGNFSYIKVMDEEEDDDEDDK